MGLLWIDHRWNSDMDCDHVCFGTNLHSCPIYLSVSQSHLHFDLGFPSVDEQGNEGEQQQTHMISFTNQGMYTHSYSYFRPFPPC